MTVQEQCFKMEASVKDHEAYAETHRVASDWLADVSQQLRLAADYSGEEDELKERLTKVEVRIKSLESFRL